MTATTNSKWSVVWDDLSIGAGQYEAYLRLGYDDIVKYYRRSAIGALWITLSVAVFVLGVGLFYTMILSGGDVVYFLSFGIGYVFWHAIASSLTNACATYTRVADVMLQRKTTLSEHAFRQISREGFLFAHILPITTILVLVLGSPPAFSGVILALLAVIAFLAIGFWMSVILGVLSTFWRDIPPIIASLSSLMFFLTPIIWTPAILPPHLLPILYLNPAAAMIELMRAGLLTKPIEAWMFINLLTTFLVLTVAGLCCIKWARPQITYWL